MDNPPKYLIAILAGGTSKRLRPFTSSNYPKQFNKEIILDRESLFQKTIINARRIDKEATIAILISAKQSHLAKMQIDEIGLANYKLIIEPRPLNTMASLVLATAFAHSAGKTKILALPSDHAISNPNKHASLLRKMLKINRDEIHIVGHRHDHPEIGNFGLIIANKKNGRGFSKKALGFLEKQGPETITSIRKDGRLQTYINSGIVFSKTEILLKEIEKANKGLLQECQKAIGNSASRKDQIEICQSYFAKINKKSFDKGLIEKLESLRFCVTAAPLEDIGSIQSLINHPSTNDRSFHGIKRINTKNCYIFNANKSKRITAVDTKDICVYSDNEDILIFDKRSTRANSLLRKISKKPAGEEYKSWGRWETILTGKGHRIKKLFILPGKSLSLQYHRQRSEVYIVLEGSGIIQKNDEIVVLGKNQTIEIPALAKHQITNASEDSPLIILEIQYGEEIKEDDIVRLL